MVSDGTRDSVAADHLRWWLSVGMLVALVLVAAVAAGVLSQEGDPPRGAAPAPEPSTTGIPTDSPIPRELAGSWCSDFTTSSAETVILTFAPEGTLAIRYGADVMTGTAIVTGPGTITFHLQGESPTPHTYRLESAGDVAMLSLDGDKYVECD